MVRSRPGAWIISAGGLRALAYAALLVAMTLALMSRPARALEPQGPLNVELRVLQVLPDRAGESIPTALARVEVTVGAVAAASDVRLELKQSDGSPWIFRSRPFILPPLQWERNGNPVEADEEGRLGILSAGKPTRAVFLVPLEGAVVHEIVVAVSARLPEGVIKTEAAALAPFDVPLPLPLVRDGVAEFMAVASGEAGQ